MALDVHTSTPKGLLAAIKKAIDDREITTWKYDKDGDFTHAPDQWANKAWMRPAVESGVLRFGLLGQKDTAMTKVIYGVYHGRFSEMLLTHFDSKLTRIDASSA